MIGTIVLIMLLGWLACTAFMAIMSSGASHSLDSSEPQAPRVSAGPAPVGAPTQDTGER